MIELAKSEPGVTIKTDQLDSNAWLLNCANGEIDLRTGELLPHDAQHLCTQISPVSYSRGAPCPTWINFLQTIMGGDSELYDYLQKVVGYCLTGSTQEQCLFVAYGTGANGKSTFIEVIKHVLGPYGATADASVLLDRRSDGPTNDIARLTGVRFVAASETAPDRKFAVSTVKTLTGGDTITARFLFKEHFEFVPQFKLFLATNHLPNVPDGELALWRRMRVIPFTVTIDPEKQDKTLLQKLKVEGPGILAWAIEGCLLWQRDGLGKPSAVRDATAEYRSEMDRVKAFIEECCVAVPSAKTPLAELYRTYENWCARNGESILTSREFGKALGAHGYERCAGNHGVAARRGIGVRDTSSPL